MHLRSFAAIAATSSLLVLAACGGGGGSSSGVVIQPPVGPIEPSVIRTSFGATKNDHYPLNARRVRPGGERPDPQDFELQSDYQSVLQFYQEILDAYEAGTCCWDMVEEESAIASRNDVLAMLRENAYEVPIGFDEDGLPYSAGGDIIAHASPPVIRFVQGTAPEHRDITMRAIDNINAWLPWEKHLTIGHDLDAATSEAVISLNALQFPITDTEHEPPDEAELARLYERLSAVIRELPPNTITANFDVVTSVGGFGSYDGFAISVDGAHIELVQHELLHSLGLSGGRACFETFGSDCDSNSSSGLQYYYSHAPVSEFPESEMAYASPRDPRHGLSAIDGEVIQTIYTSPLHSLGLGGNREQIGYLEEDRRLAEQEIEYAVAAGDVPAAEEWRQSLRDIEGALRELRAQSVISHELLSPENLGPWDDTVVRYHGSFDPSITQYQGDPLKAAFGVDWRNGMARPWTVGEPSNVALADSGLSGTATWNGEFLGFTPAQEAVNGGSAIRVNLASLDGNAAFTELSHWGAGEAPGERGTGTQWGDGDLHYTIAIAGNYLRSNGGDTGYVSGRFVGAFHQGTVGILERPDLTGAFGATRQ